MAMKWYDWTALGLLIIGGLNWGLVGAFNFNLVTWLVNYQLEMIIYVIVGLAAIYAFIRLPLKELTEG